MTYGLESLSQAFFENRDVLRIVPEATVPELHLVYDDRHGVTTLTLNHMKLNEAREANFTLGYTHHGPWGENAPATTLNRLLPPDAQLTAEDGRGFFTRRAYEDDQHDVVGLDLEALADRASLWNTAHEIGHTRQGVMVGFLCDHLVNGTVDSGAVQSRLGKYEPALDFIIGAKDISYYRKKVSEAEERDGVSKLGRFKFLGFSDELYVGTSAISEADAWVSAFRLVRQGTIHPGLSEGELKDTAFACISTYDETHDTRLFTRTLSHALRFSDI